MVLGFSVSRLEGLVSSEAAHCFCGVMAFGVAFPRTEFWPLFVPTDLRGEFFLAAFTGDLSLFSVHRIYIAHVSTFTTTVLCIFPAFLECHATFFALVFSATFHVVATIVKAFL